MKITIRYDNSITEFEVTEKECRDMIESDYRERLCGSEHPETITRRPIQVILDERFNYNGSIDSDQLLEKMRECDRIKTERKRRREKHVTQEVQCRV